MHELVQHIADLVRNTLRYRWIALVLAWPVALGGWAWLAHQPDEYRASTRVYVDTRSLLRPLMSGLSLMPNVSEQLDMVSRTLLSRPNLEQVARDSDLDLAADTDAKLEAVVEGLEARINLKGRPQDNLYTITYNDTDPARARDVVQSLLDIFVESSLSGVRTDLGSSRAFIESQVTAYEKRINELDARIREFKRENYGLLPGTGPDYYARVKENEAQLEQARLELDEAERRRDSYARRLAELEGTPGPDRSAAQRVADLEARIAEMESQLDQLSLRYTEEHPDVISTRRVLADLEKRRDELIGDGDGDGKASDDELNLFQYRSQLQFALAEAESQVASLSARVREYEQRGAQLQAAVDRIPEVEARYKDLTRDYDVVKRNFQTLLERQELAQLTGEVQIGTDPVEFRVVDPPYVPSEPAAPNRFLLASGVLMLALSAGGGAAFGLGQLRPAVTSQHALERLSSRPFLGTVSINPTPVYRRRRRLQTLYFGSGLLALMGAYLAVLGVSVFPTLFAFTG